MIGFILGLILGLVSIIFGLLWFFFSRESPVSAPKAVKTVPSDFFAPDAEFSSTVVGVHSRIPDADVIELLCDNLLRMQGIPPALYTMDKDKEPIPKLSAWTGCLHTVGVHNPVLPVSFEPKWTLNYLTLLPRAQLLVFSEAGALMGLVHLERCLASVEAPTVDALPGCALIKLYNPGG